MAAPGLDNLHIIEAGPIPANPSELLSTPAMTEFLRAVGAEYDIVLVDTPPILPVTDSAIVAGKADGVLLVYQAGKIGRLVLKRAKTHLENARAQVWGVVLNDLQTEVSGYTYTHYYTHYYGEETPGEPPRRGGGVVQRAFDRARGWFGRGRAESAPAAEHTNGGGLSVATLPEPGDAEAGETAGRGRSRTILLAVLAVLGAVGAAAAVVVWRGGLDAMSPRDVVRQRVGPTPPRQAAPASRPTMPDVPAPPPSAPTVSKPLVPDMAWDPAPPAAAPTPAPAPMPVAPPPAAAPTRATPASPPPPAAPRPAAAPATAVLAPPASPAPAPPPDAKSSKPITAATAALSPAATVPAAPPALAKPLVTPPAPVRPAPPALAAPVRPAASALAAPVRPSPPARPAQLAAITPAAPARAAARPIRFAIEFGPFVVAAEAERVERRLIEAGFPTTRSRQPSGSAVYAVLIERVPTTREARTLATALRAQGLGDAVVVRRDPVVLRVGAPVALRGAVELAERLRAAGHQVRIAAQPGEALALIVRHGAFASREEAEARRRELGQLDLPAHQVVQVR